MLKMEHVSSHCRTVKNVIKQLPCSILISPEYILTISIGTQIKMSA